MIYEGRTDFQLHRQWDHGQQTRGNLDAHLCKERCWSRTPNPVTVAVTVDAAPESDISSSSIRTMCRQRMGHIRVLVVRRINAVFTGDVR